MTDKLITFKLSHRHIYSDVFQIKILVSNFKGYIIENGYFVKNHYRKNIEEILYSKTELLLYIKKDKWEVDNSSYNDQPGVDRETDKIWVAKTVWKLMMPPCNIRLEEIQEAWRNGDR